jgi:hypothetical protein
MDGWRDVGSVELLSDRRQLLLEPLDLALQELDPGQRLGQRFVMVDGWRAGWT